VSAASNYDDLVKARTLCETLMRHAIAIDRHTRDLMKSLHESSVAIERQSTAMANALRKEMRDYPEL
jgi:predicted membrane chloride channel (bestrophin family)